MLHCIAMAEHLSLISSKASLAIRSYYFQCHVRSRKSSKHVFRNGLQRLRSPDIHILAFMGLSVEFTAHMFLMQELIISFPNFSFPPGGGGTARIRGSPTGHCENPPLCRSGPAQTPWTSFPQVWHPALLRGLGDPQGRPDDQLSGHPPDASCRNHRLSHCLCQRTLQRHGQVLPQGFPGT